tara:strand:+ start:168 stop:422 length:255 start_codon:yes stop_codon:yes gene_type:complete
MSKKEKNLPAHIITDNDIINDKISLSIIHYDIEKKGLLNLIKIPSNLSKKSSKRSSSKRSSSKRSSSKISSSKISSSKISSSKK